MIKKIISTFLITLPLYSIAADTYDPVTEIVHMPLVNVGEKSYEVDMAHQGDLVFKVVSLKEINSSPTITTNAAYQISDFTPPSGKAIVAGETPADKRLILARSADDKNFISTKQVITDQANVPDLLLVDDMIFLYYTGWTVGTKENTTALAISHDNGESWVYKYITINGLDFEHPGDPDVVRLDDGTFRIFFTATHNNKFAEIHYADGIDGINFDYKGVAYTTANKQSKDSCTFKIGNIWHMYVFLEESIHATSTDGKTFTKLENLSLSSGRSPYFIDNEIVNDDGSISLFGFSFANISNIGSFNTLDGTNFTFEGERLAFDSTSSVESKYIKNGAPLKLKDGSYILVYTSVIP